MFESINALEEKNRKFGLYADLKQYYLALLEPKATLEQRKKFLNSVKNALKELDKLDPSEIRHLEEKAGKINDLNLGSPEDIKRSKFKIAEIGASLGDEDSMVNVVNDTFKGVGTEANPSKAFDLASEYLKNSNLSAAGEKKIKDLALKVFGENTENFSKKVDSAKSSKDMLDIYEKESAFYKKVLDSNVFSQDLKKDLSQQAERVNTTLKELKNRVSQSSLSQDGQLKTPGASSTNQSGLKTSNPLSVNTDAPNRSRAETVRQLNEAERNTVNTEAPARGGARPTGVNPNQTNSEDQRILEEAKNQFGNDGTKYASLGYKYFTGKDGFPKDEHLANKLYLLGHELGDKTATNNLGINSYYGVGIEKNHEKAKQFMQEAHKRGYKRNVTDDKSFEQFYNESIAPLIKDEATNESKASVDTTPTPSVKDQAKKFESDGPKVAFTEENLKKVPAAETLPKPEYHIPTMDTDTASSVGTNDTAGVWDEPIPEQNVKLPEVNIGTDVPHEDIKQSTKDGEDLNAFYRRKAMNLLENELNNSNDVSGNIPVAPFDDDEMKAMRQLNDHFKNRPQKGEERERAKTYKGFKQSTPGFKTAKELLERGTEPFHQSDLENFYNPYSEGVIKEMRKDFDERLEKRLNQLNSSYVGKHMPPQMRQKAIDQLRKEDEREWSRHKTIMLRDAVDSAYDKYFKEKQNALHGAQSVANIAQNDRNLQLRALGDWRSESQNSEANKLQNIANMMAVGEKKRARGQMYLDAAHAKEIDARTIRQQKLDRYTSAGLSHQIPMVPPYVPPAPTAQATAPSAWTQMASMAPTLMQGVNAQQQQNMLREQHAAQMAYYKNNPNVQPNFQPIPKATGGSVTDYALDNIKKQMFDQQAGMANNLGQMAASQNPVLDGLAAFGRGMLNRPEGQVGFSSIGSALQAGSEAMQGSQEQALNYKSKEMALRTAMYNTLRVEEKEKQEAAMRREAMDLKRAALGEQATHHRYMEELAREKHRYALENAKVALSPEEKFRRSQENESAKSIIKDGMKARQSLEAIENAIAYRQELGTNMSALPIGMKFEGQKKLKDLMNGISPKHMSKENFGSFLPGNDIERLNEARERALEDVKKAEFVKEKYVNEGLPLDEILDQWEEIKGSPLQDSQKKNITSEPAKPQIDVPEPVNAVPQVEPAEGKEIPKASPEQQGDEGTGWIHDLGDFSRGLIRDTLGGAEMLTRKLGGHKPKKEYAHGSEEIENESIIMKALDAATGNVFKKKPGKTSPGVVDAIETAAKSAAALPDLILPKGAQIGDAVSGLRNLAYGERTSNKNKASDLTGEVIGTLTGGGLTAKALKAGAPLLGSNILSKGAKGLGNILEEGSKLTKGNVGSTTASIAAFNEILENTNNPAFAFIGGLTLPSLGKAVYNKFNKLSPANQEKVLKKTVSSLREKEVQALKEEGLKVLRQNVPYSVDGRNVINKLKDRLTNFIGDITEKSHLENVITDTHQHNIDVLKGKKNLDIKGAQESTRAGEGIQRSAKEHIKHVVEKGEKLLEKAAQELKETPIKKTSFTDIQKVFRDIGVPDPIIKESYKNLAGKQIVVPENFSNALKQLPENAQKDILVLGKDFVNGIMSGDNQKIFKQYDNYLKKLNSQIYSNTPNVDIGRIESFKLAKEALVQDMDKFLTNQSPNAKKYYDAYKKNYSDYYASIPKNAEGKYPKNPTTMSTNKSPEKFTFNLEDAMENNEPLFKWYIEKAKPEQIKEFADTTIYKLGKDGEKFDLKRFAKNYSALPKEMKTRLDDIFSKTGENKKSIEDIVALIKKVKPKDLDELTQLKKVNIERLAGSMWARGYNVVSEIIAFFMGNLAKEGDSKVAEGIMNYIKDISKKSTPKVTPMIQKALEHDRERTKELTRAKVR